ncbi:MAG TPA: ABC transporter permease [Thermoanaerobaculia bacterium]|nr:ABC transporter permease [Thermoanaerobaculia bacterium]
MAGLVLDLRTALRRLAKNPGFALLVILPLAFAIGANSAIFSIVNAILLHPLPYERPERLVAIWGAESQSSTDRNDLSPPDYFDLAKQSQSFEQIGAATPYWSVNLTGVAEPEKLATEVTTANLFRVLGVAPLLGRGFAASNDLPGGRREVILSHGFWQRRFGGDPGVLGRALSLDGDGFTVIGVMPASFTYLSPQTDVYLPLSYVSDRLELRSQYFLRAVGRLKPSATVVRARGEVAAIGGRLAREYPQSNAGRGFDLAPLQETVVGGVRPTLAILLGVVAFVLLIACANVANLLSLRAVRQQRQVALRVALGAARGRVVRGLFVESATFALLAGCLGLALAALGVHAFASVAPPNLPRAREIGIDGTVVVFTLGLSLLTAFLFGVLPALQTVRTDVNEALKEGARGATGGAGARLRSLLVVVELSLAIILLVGAGLLLQSFVYLRAVKPGFNPHRVLTFEALLPGTKYSTSQQKAQFFTDLVDKLATLPGVAAVGGINYLPLSDGGASAEIRVEGQPTPPGTPAPSTDARVVTSGYFSAMGIPLRAGRSFSPDDTTRAPLVVVINQTLRDRLWPGQDPLGKRIQLGPPNPRAPWITVLGVVGDVRAHGLAAEPSPQAYIHMLQSAPTGMSIVVRSQMAPAQLAAAVRRDVHTLDPDLPVSNITTLDERLASSISRERLLTALLGIFALVALMLGLIGVYGVISYSVAQRTREIGIRMALGARRGVVLKQIVAEAMSLALAGVLVGLAGAAALSRFMASLVHGISPTDRVTFAGIAALMVAASLLASYLPARRAARANPAVALRID